MPLLQIVRKNNFFGVAIQAFSCFCQALCFAPSFFLRFFLLPSVCTLPAVVVTKARLRQKLASLPLCKLYEKTTFSAWLCKHFPAFGMLFVLHRLFCIGRVFSVCRKRAQTPAQRTNEYLFFLFSAKAVLLAFLYFCFGQIFTSLHLFLAVKIIKCK